MSHPFGFGRSRALGARGGPSSSTGARGRARDFGTAFKRAREREQHLRRASLTLGNSRWGS
eukprot:14616061-Alexandrium_andersonii.AAC.1